MTHHENRISHQIESILTDATQQQQSVEDKGVRQIDATHIQIQSQLYQLVTNYREGFEIAAFEQRYQEYFEKFDFIVGDWGYEQLRLRGFYQLNQRKVRRDQTIDFLEDYLNEFCNFGCRYFVLAKEQEVAKYAKLNGSQRKQSVEDKPKASQKKLAHVQVKRDVARTQTPSVASEIKHFEQRPRKFKNQEKQADKVKKVAATPHQRKNAFVIKQKTKTN